jgi:hypothetical protein
MTYCANLKRILQVHNKGSPEKHLLFALILNPDAKKCDPSDCEVKVHRVIPSWVELS